MSFKTQLLQAASLIIVLCLRRSAGMEWCEYFEALGEYRPECAHYRTLLQSYNNLYESKEITDPNQDEYERTAVIRLVKQSGSNTKSTLHELMRKLEPKTCAPYRYYMCVENDICSSGKICMQSNGMSCCEPLENQCPQVDTLLISCNIPNPINWCNTDADCHSTPTRRCCPSGCNYNICI